MQSNKQGYILILTFFFIAISVVLITSILRQSSNFLKNAQLMRDKEKAKILALSGIQLALDQVSLIEEPQEPQEGKGNQPEHQKQNQSGTAKWFNKLFLVINKWQTVNVTQAAYGVDGYIKYFISCEQGKIDLNNFATILEKESKQTNQQAKAIDTEGKTETLASQNTQHVKSFTSVVDELVKKELNVHLIGAIKEAKNIIPLEDPSQLLRFKPFEAAKEVIFLPVLDSADKKMPIALMDLFTTELSSGKLNPWFLSYSLAKMLGLQRKLDVKLTDIAKKFKPTMDWEKEWDKTLAELYGKQFKSISPELSSMFSREFEVTAFSVIVYAKVGSMTQRLYAVLERENSHKISRNNIVFKIKKIFWF